MAKPRIFYDHDGRHPLIYMYEPPMRKEELEAAVDELLGTPVEALSLALGDVQSLLYDSQVGKLWGRGIGKWPHLIWKRLNSEQVDLHAKGGLSVDEYKKAKKMFDEGAGLVAHKPRNNPSSALPFED